VLAPDGEFFGIVIVNWDMGEVFANIASNLRSITGIEELQTYITDRNGEYIYNPDPNRMFGFEFGNSYTFQEDFTEFGTVVAQQESIGLIGQINDTSLFSADLDGERVFVQVTPMGFNSLDDSESINLISVLHRSVLDGAILATILQFWVFAILIGAGILLLLVWLLSRQLTPLRALTDAARKIAQGEYQVALPAPMSAETNNLVQALEFMKLEISGREKELRDHQDSLEKTVADRTRELVIARDEANRQAKYKGEFLANMSHEVRTPMTAIIGLLDVLRHTEMSSRQQQYVFQIHNSSRALLHVINDILDISKIEAGKVDIESVDFSLVDTLEDVVDLFASSADLKSVNLHLKFNIEQTNEFIGDRTRLAQVLNNLVGNALKFTEKGEVILKAEITSSDSSSARVRFSVSDTGIGISEEAMARLFTAFEQGDTATTRMFGGTGLGLAISQKLVELMGGQLLANSESGKGSEFWFELQLPLSEKPDRKLCTTTNLGKKVLLVSSEPVVVEIIEEMLASWKCRIQVANAYEHAQECVSAALESRAPFELILLDWRLPEMNGYNLIDDIHTLYESAGFKFNPSILLITEGELIQLQDSTDYRSGIKVLRKPVTISRL